MPPSRWAARPLETGGSAGHLACRSATFYFTVARSDKHTRDLGYDPLTDRPRPAVAAGLLEDLGRGRRARLGLRAARRTLRAGHGSVAAGCPSRRSSSRSATRPALASARPSWP